jgi:hypothetical protein
VLALRLDLAILTSKRASVQVYDYIMQSLTKYRNLYMEMVKNSSSPQDLHASHDLLASAAASAQVCEPPACPP